MADLLLRGSAAQVVDRLKEAWVTKWWLRVVLVWAATRAFTVLGFLWANTLQGPTPWDPTGHPAYFKYLDTWDAEWYRKIYLDGLGNGSGYNHVLPLNANGAVRQNAWAFMPGYPMLIRLITSLLTLKPMIPVWSVVGNLVSLALSFGVALMVYRVLNLKLDAKTSLWAVLFFGLWPASPVLQTPYAESLGLLLLAFGLYYLIQHRYLAAAPWLVGLSITRPGMISFALMLAGMWVVRFVKHRRGSEEFPSLERWKLAALTLFSGFLGLIWPLFAWWATGRQDAYTVTELAWRMDVPDAKLVYFSGWVYAGHVFFGEHFGSLFLPFAMTLTAAILIGPVMRKLGNEMRLWVASYMLYLFAVFHAQSSTWRILLPAFPLIGGFALLTTNLRKWQKAVIVVIMAALQLWWLKQCWNFASPDITPP